MSQLQFYNGLPLFGTPLELAMHPDCCCQDPGGCIAGLAGRIGSRQAILTVQYESCADTPVQWYPEFGAAYEFFNCANMSVADLVMPRMPTFDLDWGANNPTPLPPPFSAPNGWRCNTDSHWAMLSGGLTVRGHVVRLRCATDTLVRIEYYTAYRQLGAESANGLVARLEVPWTTFNPGVTHALTPVADIPCTPTTIFVRWA